MFGWPFVKWFALCYRSVVCLSFLFFPLLSVCDVGVLWPNGWMDQGETWHEGRPRSQPHCVRYRPSSSLPKGAQPSQLLAHVCCGQISAWIKVPLGMEVGLSPSDIVLDGDLSPPPKKGTAAPTFWSMYCGQTAGWIQMPLGMEVGRGPVTLF